MSFKLEEIKSCALLNVAISVGLCVVKTIFIAAINTAGKS